MKRNSNCELCSLCQSSKHVCIWGTGDGSHGFIIGEAPGQAEAKTGKPFMGESGKILRAELSRQGIENAYITNVAKCRPPGNRKPEPSEMAACRPYLDEEIAAQKPKAILLLGATAMKAMIRKTSITEMNGQVVEKDGNTYVCAFHPAYILRDPSKMPAFSMAISRYVSVLKGELNTELPGYRVVDKSTLDEFLIDWVKAIEISFDVETTGLDWWAPDFDINSIQFGMKLGQDGEASWVLPLAKWPVLDFESRRKLLVWLQDQSISTRKVMIGQNGKYDNLCLMRKFGVRFHLGFDTLLSHHLIDENSSHDLKTLTRSELGWPDYDIPLKEKKGGIYSQSKFFGYGAADAVGTLRLRPRFHRQMDEDDQWIFNKLTMPAARAFEEIEADGLYVDLKRMNEVEIEQRKLMASVLSRLNKVAHVEINWNSPDQVAEVLYGKLGLEPMVFTPKKKPSTSELALKQLDHPVVKLIEKYREHQKFLSTYIGDGEEGEGGWRNFMDGPHLHLSTKLSGTVTGRYSSRLHQVPRDGSVRNLIIAPPGWTHFEADLPQAELKIIAIVAREPELLRCFKEGIDVHWRTLMAAVESGGGEYVEAIYDTAKQTTKRKLDFPDALEIVRNMTPEQATELWKGWSEGRKKAKGINFGFVYDQSPPGFIDYATAKYGFTPTLEEATSFHTAFFNLYRALPDWHERQRKLARRDGLVRNLIGRKRHLPGIYSKDRSVVGECERQAINAPIQGFIGDYKAMALVEAHQTFPRAEFRITGEVHDAILFMIKNESVKTMLPDVAELLRHPKLIDEAGLKFPIEIGIEIKQGPWGAGKLLKRV